MARSVSAGLRERAESAGLADRMSSRDARLELIKSHAAFAVWVHHFEHLNGLLWRVGVPLLGVCTHKGFDRDVSVLVFVEFIKGLLELRVRWRGSILCVPLVCGVLAHDLLGMLRDRIAPHQLGPLAVRFGGAHERSERQDEEGAFVHHGLLDNSVQRNGAAELSHRP